MEGDVEQRQRGSEAFDASDWGRAYACYREADRAGEPLSPDELERMANAAWLSGEPATEEFDRACEAFEKAGRIHDAVRVALDLADISGVTGQIQLVMGWIRRASRMLESAPEGPGHARLALMQGFMAVLSGRVGEALEQVERAHALARAHGDEDTEALALSRRAALLLRLGRLDEASADADEAMLFVHRERARPVSGAMIYCNTIDFCRNLGDFERALAWSDAAARWTTERQVCGFPGICRVHRAELLRLQGDHVQAESELRAAIEIFERHRFRFGIAEALAELGQLRLEINELDAASSAFQEAEETGHEPLPGLAILALRRGDAAGARGLLEPALEEKKDNPLGRAKLLPTLVEACIETGDLAAARAAADELRDTASRIGTVGIQAHAETAAARVHLAAGEAKQALGAGRAATRAWKMVGACYELAQARELLARAYEASGDAARARLERARVQSTRDGLSASAATVAAYGSGRSTPPAAATQAAAGGQSAPQSAETLAAEAVAQPGPLAAALPVRAGVTLGDKIAIGGVLGMGGMGVVHAGKHLVTGRDVAVKVLRRSSCGDSERCARFLAEARACGRIRHANVVDVYDAGMHGDEPYIVMERLEGRSLEQMLAEGDQPPLGRALSIGEQAARGVAAAHQAGVIHRDLKPANIFVTEGCVKVLDFGISKQPEGHETRPGEILGTPFYMAPEQITSPAKVDARTDVYALGAVLFELLTGEPPFAADSVPAVLHAITSGPEPDLRGVDVPAEVELLVRRALARDPAQRPGSAAELADELARLREAQAAPG